MFDLNKHLTFKSFLFIALLIITAVPFFYKLGNSPLRQYDESFYALKAFEWAEHGNYLQKYSNDTQLLNTKPYLFVWVQARFYKVFGYDNLSLRFPVALTAWFTCILCWFYLRRVKAQTAAYLTALVLATTIGFLDHHMSRTGDHDAPLVFFLMLQLYFSYLLLEEGKTSLLYFIALSLSLTAATLTKGIIGLGFLPGIFLYSIMNKKLKGLLQLPQLYISIALFLLLIISYYVHRELSTPGYQTSVWNYEIGRFFERKYAENPEFSYFFRLLIYEQFYPWIVFVPFGFIYLIKPSPYSRLLSLTAFAGFCFLFIISLSKVKLRWYDAPVFPVLSIFAGVGLSFLYDYLIKLLPAIKPYFITLFILLGIYCYYKAFDRIEKQLHVPASEKFEPALYYLKANYPEEKNITLVASSHFNPHIKFIMTLFSEKYGYQFALKKSTSTFYPGEKILVSEPHTIRTITKNVNSKLLVKEANVEFREVIK